jgi:glutathionylspermidine synthase
MLYGIFDKVISEYTHNPDFRKKFGFSRELEELILLRPQFKSNIPIARIDLFYNDETGEYKFCEFNTDGSSAMNEDRELNNALKLTEGYRIFSERYCLETSEFFDSWVNCLNVIYNDYLTGKGEEQSKKPFVVITDFLEGGTTSEFEVFKSAFEKNGYQCEICDIRNFSYTDGKLLTPSGNTVDAIYRRAVTNDIMQHYADVQPLINAVKDNNVCLVGGFRTQLAHNKILFEILWDKDVWNIFTADEVNYIKARIPFTTLLTDAEIAKNDVIKNKDKWIIKPQDSYASRGFFSGAACTDEEWTKAVE